MPAIRVRAVTATALAGLAALLIFFATPVRGADVEPGMLLLQGVHALRSGDYDTATNRFDALLAEPQSTALQREAARGYRGSAHLRAGHFAEAAADFDHALTLNPRSTWVLSERCWLHYRTGEMRRARLDADRALLRDPVMTNALRCRVRVGIEEGRYRLARADLEALLRLEKLPKNRRLAALRDMGDVHYRIGQYATAALYFRRALALGGDHAGTQAALCRVLLFDDRPMPAVSACEAALKRDAGNVVARDSLALAHYRLGRHERALDLLDALLREDPDRWFARYHRAMVLEALGESAAARRDFRIARRLAPDAQAFTDKERQLAGWRRPAAQG